MKLWSEHKKGIAALILLSLVFASMGLFARFLQTDFLLLQQVYLRVFAAFVLSVVFFRKDIHLSTIKKISRKEWALLIFRAGTFYLIGVTLFTQAIITTKYSNVSFIGALPFVAILGVILLKERMTWHKLLFILTAFVGVILLAIQDYQHIFAWGNGEVLALVSTFSFALSYVASRWHSTLLNNKEITAIILGIGALMVFLTSLVFGEGLPLTNWSVSLFSVVLLAGLFNVVNLFLTNYGFRKVEAILASNILNLESIFAVGLGLVFFKELPVLKELFGGILIVLSVIGLSRVEGKG